MGTERIPVRGDRRRTRVGLLGGSFNPAHEGHRHVAQLALRRLRLHQVWLLVSPGNPLKPRHGMADLPDRLASARSVADGRRVVATALEARLRTRYTFDTLRALRRLFPRVSFVWLMGADNLVQFPRWQHWTGIAALLPMAVMPRPTYNQRALHGQAALRLRAGLLPARRAPVLAAVPAPAWTFLPARQHPASATAIRAGGAAGRQAWPPDRSADPLPGYPADPSPGYPVDPTPERPVDPSPGCPVDPSPDGGAHPGLVAELRGVPGLATSALADNIP